MKKAIVAIVGRPNVGKSTLFNRMVRKRQAVIEDIPGITRDRLYGNARWDDKPFIVVDTGGFQDGDEEFSGDIRKQVFFAVEEADLIIMLLDGESGLLPLDRELINGLRKYGKRVFYAVNKIDGPNKEKALLPDFYQLGVTLYPLSALNGNGIEEMMEDMAALFPDADEEVSEYPRVAIIGRPNVGKSTLVNALLSKERMIVSSVAGTTRDAVDSLCTYYGKKYVLVDTAGIRKRGKMAQTVERYSFLRTVRNIEECDVALIVLDASEGIVELDLKIAGLVTEAGKGAVLLFNKWDLVDKEALSVDDVKDMVYGKLWFMRHVPVLTISAESRQRMTKLFPMIDTVLEESSRRIPTHELNQFLRNTVAMKEPPMYKGKRVKIYYMTQVKTKPPGFIVFTNKKEGVREQYRKYLERQLREKFNLMGVPLNIFVRQRESKH
jgi:GTP-binding protein